MVRQKTVSIYPAARGGVVGVVTATRPRRRSCPRPDRVVQRPLNRSILVNFTRLRKDREQRYAFNQFRRTQHRVDFLTRLIWQTNTD